MALISECAMTHGNAPTTWRISDSATSEVVAGAGIKLEYPADQEVPEAPVVEAPAVEAPAVEAPAVEAPATGAALKRHYQLPAVTAEQCSMSATPSAVDLTSSTGMFRFTRATGLVASIKAIP